MIFPLLNGVYSFFRAPATWVIVFVQITFFVFLSQSTQRTEFRKILRSQTFLKTQGQIYSNFVIQRQPAYDKETVEFVMLAQHTADPKQMLHLGQIAMQDPAFKADVAKPLWLDSVMFKWWQQKYKKLQEYKNSHPNYILGVSGAELNFGNWLTYQFVHNDFMHLITNMVFFILFGAALEVMLGSLALISVFICGGLFSAGMFLFFEGGSSTPMIGASGSVSAVIALFCAVNLRRGIRYVYFLFIPQRGYAGYVYLPGWLALFSFLLADAAGFFAGQTHFSSVAHMAHIGGQLTGILVAMMFFLSRKVLFKSDWPELPDGIGGPAFKVEN